MLPSIKSSVRQVGVTFCLDQPRIDTHVGMVIYLIVPNLGRQNHNSLAVTGLRPPRASAMSPGTASPAA